MDPLVHPAGLEPVEPGLERVEMEQEREETGAREVADLLPRPHTQN
jgi:hypothetical protein